MLKKSLKESAFTLIELLVLTAQHCRDFISNACIVSLQNTPLFLKAKGSARGKENFFSRITPLYSHRTAGCDCNHSNTCCNASSGFAERA